jgi:hypothetical protein
MPFHCKSTQNIWNDKTIKDKIHKKDDSQYQTHHCEEILFFGPKSDTVQIQSVSIWTALYKNRPDSLNCRGYRKSTLQRQAGFRKWPSHKN